MIEQWGNSDSGVIPTICPSSAIFLPRQGTFCGTTGQVDSPPCTMPSSVVVLPVAFNLSRNIVRKMLQNLLNIICLTIPAISGH